MAESKKAREKISAMKQSFVVKCISVLIFVMLLLGTSGEAAQVATDYIDHEQQAICGAGKCTGLIGCNVILLFLNGFNIIAVIPFRNKKERK